jgi:transposase-like protein
MQEQAKARLQEIWMAPTKAQGEKAFELFLEAYQAKYPKATECLAKDRDELLAFYGFPAAHWVHIRTTNPIESTLATVRLRTDKTRGCLSRTTALTMVCKLCKSAERRWRKLNGSAMLGKVLEGIEFRDGAEVTRYAA